jgi:hypothetical protein
MQMHYKPWYISSCGEFDEFKSETCSGFRSFIAFWHIHSFKQRHYVSLVELVVAHGLEGYDAGNGGTHALVEL